MAALLAAAVDVNFWNEYVDHEPQGLLGSRGGTALMLASELGRVEIAAALLAAGADVGLQDRHGNDALNYAGSEKMKKLLEDAKSTVRAK